MSLIHSLAMFGVANLPPTFREHLKADQYSEKKVTTYPDR